MIPLCLQINNVEVGLCTSQVLTRGTVHVINLPRLPPGQMDSVTIISIIYFDYNTLNLFFIEYSGLQHVRYQPRLRVALMMTSPPDTADRSSLIETLTFDPTSSLLSTFFFISIGLSAFSFLFVSELRSLFGEDSVRFVCLLWAEEPHKHLQFRPLQSTLTSTTFVADSLLISSV